VTLCSAREMVGGCEFNSTLRTCGVYRSDRTLHFG